MSFLFKLEKKNLIISLLLLIFVLQSCEEILQIKLPENTTLITVNCILSDGKPIHMDISQSQPYPNLTDSIQVIKNAIVQLFEDNKYIEDLVYQEFSNIMNENGYPQRVTGYNSLNDFRPRNEHSYSIKVTTAGFPEVTSTTYLPKPVPVISVDTNTAYTKSGRYQYKTLECKIRFKDPPGERNYYSLSINRIGLFYLSPGSVPGYSGTYTINYIIPFFCNDPNAIFFRRPPASQLPFYQNSEDEEAILNQIFISDDSFDGKSYELMVMIPFYSFEDRAYPMHGEKFNMRKINIKLSSINNEYYKYARTNYIQLYKKNDLFSEPCYVFTNINNGVGIFSGSSISIDSSLAIPIYYNPWFSKK